MRPAYVRVDLGDPADNQAPRFVVSPVPFLYHEGELQMSGGAKLYGATSYSVLRLVLKDKFQIPNSMLPLATYFKPKKSEIVYEDCYIYRTVPEGAGEPEWRMKARQAIMWAIDEPRGVWPGDSISVNGKSCYSMEELQHELEAIAEAASGKMKAKDEAYQPDYDVLVKEVLAIHPYVFCYENLSKNRKR
ncbi:MAG: hypothetical protein IPJ44_00025 [Nitrospira sp.]|nr:hypothetical protein [Nitrospira sp.]